MSNFTENENWIDKLVDELIDAKDALIDCESKRGDLYTFTKIVLNNTELDYSGEKLRIDSDSAILEYLRAICPESYNNRLTDLKEAKAERCNARTEEGSANG